MGSENGDDREYSGQTDFLAVRNKLTAQYIQIAQATTSLRLHLTPGQQRPILARLSSCDRSTV